MNLNHYNTEQFDVHEAPTGHKERFAIKLLEQQKKRHRKMIMTWTSVAASISLLIVFGLSFFQLEDPTPTPADILQTSCYSQELEELQFYYTSQEQNKIERIKDLGLDSNLLEQEILQMDTMIKNLCSELNTAPNDERIIEMAVQHYTMKLNTLDHILTQLESIKHKKDKKDETINL